MHDSLFFFDQFKKVFLEHLDTEESIRHNFLIKGKLDFNEILEQRGNLDAIVNIKRIFEQIEKQMKKKYFEPNS